jgi:hypothetical protein
MTDVSLYHDEGLVKPEMLSKIAFQINKDFGSFGQIVYEENCLFSSVDDLIGPLFQAVSTLLRQDKRKMMQIIYRVDINENQLGTALAEAKGDAAAEVLTELIIAREFTKIQIRDRSH